MNNPYFLLILAPLIWGGHAVVGKLGLHEIAPMTMALLRWSAAALILFPLVYKRLQSEWGLIRPNLTRLFLFGAFGFAGFNMLNYQALVYTTALNTALLQAAIPMLILFINCIFFKHKLNKLQLIGIIMAFTGVLLIMLNGDLLAFFALSFNRGDLIMLIACLMYAGYSIGLAKKVQISWFSFIFVLVFSAFLTSLPFALYEIFTQDKVFSLSLNSMLTVLYIGILASIFAQIAYAKAVGMIGANRAGFALNLVPVFGALLSVIFLGEDFRWYHLIGLILVLSGIALSEKSTKRNKNT